MKETKRRKYVRYAHIRELTSKERLRIIKFLFIKLSGTCSIEYNNKFLSESGFTE